MERETKGEDTEYGLVVLRLKTTRSTRLELSQGQPDRIEEGGSTSRRDRPDHSFPRRTKCLAGA